MGSKIKFNLRCKVCGKIIGNEKPIEHIKTHESTNYFDLVGEVGWGDED